MAASSEASEAMESTTGVGFFGKVLERYFDELYLVFRLVFAFLVVLHGAQKAFLLWGFPAAHPPGRPGGYSRLGGVHLCLFS